MWIESVGSLTSFAADPRQGDLVAPPVAVRRSTVTYLTEMSAASV